MERQEFETLHKEYLSACDFLHKVERAQSMLGDVEGAIEIKIRTPNWSTFDFEEFMGSDVFEEIKQLFKTKVREYYDKCVNDFVNHQIDISMFLNNKDDENKG